MLNKEDKADVSRSMGKALANKVKKVTQDYKPKISQHFADLKPKHRIAGDASRVGRGMRELGEGNYVKLKPVSKHTGDTMDSPNIVKYRAYKANGGGGILTNREKQEIYNRKK